MRKVPFKLIFRLESPAEGGKSGTQRKRMLLVLRHRWQQSMALECTTLQTNDLQQAAHD